MKAIKTLLIASALAILVGCGEEEEKLMENAEIVEKVTECSIKVKHQDNVFLMNSRMQFCSDTKAMEVGNIVDIYYERIYWINRFEH